MIIHFHVKLHLPADEISITLDPNEVSGSAWLDSDDLINAFYSQKADKMVQGFDVDLKPVEYRLQEFFPYFGYPGNKMQSNAMTNSKTYGMSKASMYALRYLWMLIFKLF